jgi:DNA-binding CsgD family transcriptional regulator
LRLTGDTLWLEKTTWRDFVDYEATLDRTTSKARIKAICTYSLDKCQGAEVIDVVKNHGYTLIKRGEWELIENAQQKRVEELVKAVVEAVAGRRYLSPPLSQSAIDAYVQRASTATRDRYDSLSSREREVLQLAAEGHTNAEIGRRLFISPRTVEIHRANMMQKLGLRNQTDLLPYIYVKRKTSAILDVTCGEPGSNLRDARLSQKPEV